jgi:hypothetical protein
MKKFITRIGALSVGLIVVGAIYGGKSTESYTEKQYSVNHTVPDWQKTVEGNMEVDRIIHKSKLPADEAFYCDSVLQTHNMDISRQVNAGMIADTSKTKKP